MKAAKSKKARRLDRMQNLTILLLTLSALALFVNLPLFGPLADSSLLELARVRLSREHTASASVASGAVSFTFPVRMVYTNDFTRLGTDALTTLSDEFERAGPYLGEAVGSSYDRQSVGEFVFLSALRGEGLYFDFPVAMPSEILAALLNVTVPDAEVRSIRRVLLTPGRDQDALLYLEDGTGAHYRFSTAVSSEALSDFLSSRSGSSADFAYMLGPDYSELSPYTLILSEPSPRSTLSVFNALSGNEDTFLRRAEFNPHTENRFTESTGTTIVREVSSTLYLRADGTLDYQGGEAAPGSIYRVPAAKPNEPTLVEAAGAAQKLAVGLLQDSLGEAALYLSGIASSAGTYEITFDLMIDGTPLRFSDGSHAVSITVRGQNITAFTCKARRYALNESVPLLLPFAQAVAIARAWDSAELLVAYVDAGGDTVSPTWIAE